VTQTPSLARLWRRRKQRGWRSRDRLTHLILGGAIFAGAIASCGSYLWVRKLVLDRARRETLLHLQFHRESIDLWLAARKQEIAQLARSPALQTMDWSAAQPYLRQEIDASSEIESFGMYKPDGSLFTTLEGRPPALHPKGIQQAMAGRMALSKPFRDRRSNLPRIAISAPISDLARTQPLGVLTGTVRSEGLGKIIGRLTLILDSSALILHPQGIAARDSGLETDRHLPSSIREAAIPKLQALSRRTDGLNPAIERVKLQGQAAYLAYLPLEEADWAIALVIPPKTLEQDLNVLNLLAGAIGGMLVLGVGGLIRFVRTSEHFRLRAEREALLNRLTQRIRASLDLDETLQATVKEVGTLLSLERAAFAWFDPQTQIWDIEHKLVYPPLSPLNPKVRSIPLTAAELNRKTQGYLAFPIHTQAGRQGYLICQQANRGQWSRLEKELLQAVTDQLAIAITQSDLYHQIQQQLKVLKRTQAHLVQREKMSSLGRMVAGIAHEINNPINFIYANHLYVHQYATDLLKLLKLYQQSLGDLPSEIQDFEAEIDWDFISEDLPQILKSMKSGAERIHNIVLSLRNFSRLDESELKVVDIHEGIESTLLLLQGRLDSAIAVAKHYGDLPKVECYPGQLNQVFMNVLSNSIDAVEAVGGASGAIAISTALLAAATPPSVRISIKDSGAGIPAEIQAQIFDPFFTTKPVGQGTGLGLAVSYQIIVDLHRGKIRVRTPPEGGTEVIVEIPVRAEGKGEREYSSFSVD